MKTSCDATKAFFELAHGQYFNDFSVLEKAYFLLEQRHTESQADYLKNSVRVALILCKVEMDFAIVLSSLFYLSIKHKIISIDECGSVCDSKTLSHLRWLLQVEDMGSFKDFCTEFLQAKNADSYQDPQRLSIVLAFFVDQIRSIDFLERSREKDCVALDSLGIYSAFAEKIGMLSIKQEIEDLAFKSLNPEARAAILEILETSADEYRSVANHIINTLEKNLVMAGIKSQIFWRQKSPYSIWLKMIKKCQSFDKIVDILGLRILVNSVEECYRVLGIVHADNIIVPKFFDDFINIPKPNGYRSIHTVIEGPLEHKIEIQIRTYEMQDQSEEGLTAHWIYKNQIHKNLIFNYEGLEALTGKDFFVDEQFGVFCTLIDGSRIYLSNGGIVLDVAFKVSYDVGMACVGAKINGAHVSLLRKVSNGDHIEILTSDFVYEGDEEREINQNRKIDPEVSSYFKKYFLDKSLSKFMYSGERTLKNLCSLFGVKVFESFLENLNKNLKLASVEDLLLKVGKGDLSLSKLVDFIIQQRSYSYGYGLKIGNFFRLNLAKLGISFFQRSPFTYEQIKLAQCCYPIPGDNVIGCFGVEEGLIVHRTKCSKLKKLSVNNRIMPIDMTSWKKDVSYHAYLKIIFPNGKMSVMEVSSAMSEFGANIYDIQMHERSTELIYVIKVNNVEEINAIISCINKKHLAFQVKRAFYND
jgi:GTP pyrophosphokinase